MVSSWQSVHIHHHEEDLTPLVAHGVGLFSERLREWSVKHYWDRHWFRGPHVRLNVFAPPRTFHERILPAAKEVIGGYLREHPSSASAERSLSVAVQERLAEQEGIGEPLTPWVRDDSVASAAYEDRSPHLGAVAWDVMTDHFVSTAPAMLHFTRSSLTQAERLDTAFGLMLATVHASGGGLPAKFGSFRSHAEAYLNLWPEGRGQRESWERHYDRARGVLVAKARSVLAAVDEDGRGAKGGRGTDASGRMWREWAEHARVLDRRVHEAIDAGDITTRMTDEQVDSGPQAEALLAVSPYHRAIVNNDYWRENVRNSPWFAGHRFVLNCMYLQLTRLGVSPSERFLLCHLAANTAQELYGVSAFDIARGRVGGGTSLEAAR